MNCEGQIHITVSTDHNFWRERRAKAESSRGPAAYQPNTLLLDEAGSQNFKPENGLNLDQLWSVAGAMFVWKYGQVQLK